MKVECISTRSFFLGLSRLDRLFTICCFCLVERDSSKLDCSLNGRFEQQGIFLASHPFHLFNRVFADLIWRLGIEPCPAAWQRSILQKATGSLPNCDSWLETSKYGFKFTLWCFVNNKPNSFVRFSGSTKSWLLCAIRNWPRIRLCPCFRSNPSYICELNDEDMGGNWGLMESPQMETYPRTHTY